MSDNKPFIDFNLRASFPEKELRDKFFESVTNDDLAAVEAVLKTHPEAVTWQKFGISDGGETGFRKASQLKGTAMMELLLKYGADIDVKDQQGWTTLNIACLRADDALAEFLLKRGANAELANESGNTPLMTAVKQDSWPCADLLVIAGADVEREDRYSSSAIDMAQAVGNNDIIKVIRDAQDRRAAAELRRANPDTRTDTGEDIKALKPIELKTGEPKSKWLGKIFKK